MEAYAVLFLYFVLSTVWANAKPQGDSGQVNQTHLVTQKHHPSGGKLPEKFFPENDRNAQFFRRLLQGISYVKESAENMFGGLNSNKALKRSASEERDESDESKEARDVQKMLEDILDDEQLVGPESFGRHIQKRALNGTGSLVSLLSPFGLAETVVPVPSGPFDICELIVSTISGQTMKLLLRFLSNGLIC